LSPQLEGDAMPFRSLPAALGILWISVFALPVSASPIPASSAVPQTHAHNDYEHPNPLYDALSWGFISAEADIWLYPDDNDNLRVAHDPVADPTTLPTLQELYLDPLVQQFNTHADGGIYADGTPLHLLVDIKSVGSPTYARLHQILADYADANPGLFTTFTKTGSDTWEVVEGAVNISISGNRPRADMEDQDVRYAAYDGRAADIGSGASSDFIRLISDNWKHLLRRFRLGRHRCHAHRHPHRHRRHRRRGPCRGQAAALLEPAQRWPECLGAAVRRRC
jgi:hypothetical protein